MQITGRAKFFAATVMRYDGEHKERTRVRLLTEAAIMLREEGPHGLSVATLMKRQGLTHGGFYAHFESKDDLIEHAIDAMFERTCERFRIKTKGLTAEAALTNYITYYLSPSHYNRPGQGCPIPATGADVGRLEPEARKRFEAGVNALAGLIAAEFERLHYPAGEAMSQALTLLADMSGAVVMARGVKSAALAKQICAGVETNIFARLGFALQNESADDKAAVTTDAPVKPTGNRVTRIQAGLDS